MGKEMKLYLMDGKAFLEVSNDYLLCIGDESFVRCLSKIELYNLCESIMLELKQGIRNLDQAERIH